MALVECGELGTLVARHLGSPCGPCLAHGHVELPRITNPIAGLLPGRRTAELSRSTRREDSQAVALTAHDEGARDPGSRPPPEPAFIALVTEARNGSGLGGLA
jgi:hypothetical protein